MEAEPPAPQSTGSSETLPKAPSLVTRVGRLLRRYYLQLSLLVSVLLAVATVLVAVPTPYQVLRPGPLTDVLRLIEPHPPSKGALYLTTIYSDPASLGEWLYARVDPDAGVIPREQARPPNVSERSYQQALRGMMDESKVVAQVVAMREAGLDVQITGQGAQVQEIAENSRAKGILQQGDIIVAVGGEAVQTGSDLVARVQSRRPGDTVQLTIKRDDRELSVEIILGESPDEPGRARAGLVILTHLYSYKLPLEVKLPTRDIGGPSAGLVFSLGVYSSITSKDITSGHRVAGTGTISTDGRVGPVGGVKYKVAAAEHANVEVFLVPRENADEARQRARHVKIVPVDTFKDALAALRALGAA